MTALSNVSKSHATLLTAESGTTWSVFLSSDPGIRLLILPGEVFYTRALQMCFPVSQSACRLAVLIRKRYDDVGFSVTPIDILDLFDHLFARQCSKHLAGWISLITIFKQL